MDEATDALNELLADAEQELGRELTDEEAESIADEFLAGLDDDDDEDSPDAASDAVEEGSPAFDNLASSIRSLQEQISAQGNLGSTITDAIRAIPQPVVNVQPPVINVAPPAVNMPAITIEAPRPVRTVRTVERDADKMISRITEESEPETTKE